MIDDKVLPQATDLARSMCEELDKHDATTQGATLGLVSIFWLHNLPEPTRARAAELFVNLLRSTVQDMKSKGPHNEH